MISQPANTVLLIIVILVVITESIISRSGILGSKVSIKHWNI